METPTCSDPEFRNQARTVQNLIINRFKGLRYLGIIDDQEYALVLATVKKCRECVDQYSVNKQGMIVEYKDDG